MKRSAQVSSSKWWRPLGIAVLVLLGLSSIMVWTWYVLDQREQRYSQRRFAVDVQSVVEMVHMRMQAYEMVLRGVSSAFAGDEANATYAQWREVVDQLRVWELYPGISSIVWSRYLQGEQISQFLAKNHADGRPDFKIFPEGLRGAYLPVEYIGPVNERTRKVEGLDLLTQGPQSPPIRKAIDSGQTVMSMPLPDLYAVSPEPTGNMGVLMYFPVYQTGMPPATEEARRNSFLGMTNAAFRGQELAEGIFGIRLRLFQVSARDVVSDLPLFDTAHVRPMEAPPDWEPSFRSQLEVPIYGRTWRLDIIGTPEYERGLISSSHNLVLLIGLGTAVLLALLSGTMAWQHDRQLYSSQVVSTRLREQARQLALANRYKSEFLANMSHELRTPLNSILILSDQLRQNGAGNLSEKQTRHADIVYRAGSDLLQLINDVLDLAKIEAGRVQLNLEPLSLQDLLIDLDAAMRPQAEAKKLQLYIPTVTADANLPQRIYSDRVRLHQILRNLLSNAIKFTDAGQVNVSVSLGETRPDGRVELIFAVRDTGVGIAPELQDQAFVAFAQLDGSTRRRHGGTGLGLPITRQLVLALDGEITMQSALGQGSTFTVKLPVQTVQALPAAELLPPQRAGEGPALLVVEDDQNFAAIIIEQAHAHGFASVHCMSGQQALELLRGEMFSAVILDILLPDISGWQLFRRLRALPAHRYTPVHIISCLPEPSGMEQAHDAHYLTKPIGQEALEQVFASLSERGNVTRRPALLLVEDVAVEREHYRQQLEALGFAVTACATASEARALWADTQYAVVVVDLSLPDQDGFALLDALDAQRPLAGTRVVVNTGLDVKQDGMQRLHGYSAVVVHKRGEDTTVLAQAVQGFLVSLSHAVDGYAVTPAPAAGRLAPAPAPAPVPDTTSLTPVTPPVASAPAGMSPAPAPIVLPMPAAVSATAGAANALQGRHLMLVDDDVRNVYALSALLDDFGLEVSTASNGEEAIALYRQAPVDLILMDMSMPVMDGYTATNLLKSRYNCTVPIIALTAHAMKGDREKCMAAGADDYLAKPVNRDELRTMLERWLDEEPGPVPQTAPASNQDPLLHDALLGDQLLTDLSGLNDLPDLPDSPNFSHPPPDRPAGPDERNHA